MTNLEQLETTSKHSKTWILSTLATW